MKTVSNTSDILIIWEDLLFLHVYINWRAKHTRDNWPNSFFSEMLVMNLLAFSVDLSCASDDEQ